jgi:hypothetical protein
VRFAAQKGHFRLGSLYITAVDVVYPVRKRLMTTCSRLVIVLVFVLIIWCGLTSLVENKVLGLLVTVRILLIWLDLSNIVVLGD